MDIFDVIKAECSDNELLMAAYMIILVILAIFLSYYCGLIVGRFIRDLINFCDIIF